MSINILATEIHENAKSKGWWNEEHQNIMEKIALIHSELSEALEEYRNGHEPNEIYFKDGKPEGFPIELADTIMRTLDLSERFNINMRQAIEMKMAYNKTRPYKHGGKKC